MTRQRLGYLEQVIAWLRVLCVPHEDEPAARFSRADYGVVTALALVAAAIVVWGGTKFDPRVYDYWNIYFQADPNRVLADMTERYSPEFEFERKGGVHPTFSMFAYPLMQSLMWLGLDKVSAASILVVASAAASSGLFYLALRGLGLSVFAALGFSSAFLASATYIHWFTFIETYVFASLTIVIMLFVATSYKYTSRWAWIVASAATLSITITNWALGLATSFFRLSFQEFIKVTAAAFILVVAIMGVQKVVFPTSRLFFSPYMLEQERCFTQVRLQKEGHTRWTPGKNLFSMLITSAVAPPPSIEDASTPGGIYRLVNNQYATITRTPPAGQGAIACWLFMLGTGVWGAWRNTAHRTVAIAIGAYMLFQLGMHSVYGEITFLYAGNFFPALLMLAAFGRFTPLRHFVVCAAVVFTILAGVNNYAQFLSAVRLSNDIAAHYPGVHRPVSLLGPVEEN